MSGHGLEFNPLHLLIPGFYSVKAESSLGTVTPECLRRGHTALLRVGCKYLPGSS